MAQLYPSVLDPNTKSTAERRLYEAFARELKDDAWVAFHHNEWIGNDDRGRPCDGEADFVVAHPHLGVLTIEVKGGRIRFDAATGHFISTDRDDVEHDIGDPFEQAMKSKHVLIDKLRSTRGWPHRRIVFGHMVALPDAVVEAAWLRPNAPREIILDALDMVSLEVQLRKALMYWQGQVRQDTPPGQGAMEILIRVLGQAENIRNPFLAEQLRADEQALTTLTVKQCRYLKFLKGQRRAAIAGCAGSGKTFLALEKARSLTEEEGLKVLLTCYNRALADFLGDELGYRRRFDVFSFHQLCVHWANQTGQHLAYREDAPPEYYNITLPDVLLAAVEKVGSQYDAIIVDEGQDFRDAWWGVLPWVLRNPSTDILYVFFDDNQRIYRDRSAIPIESPPYTLDENCRNTQHIFDVVKTFYAGPPFPTPIGPEGQPVHFIPYADSRDGERQLQRLLYQLFNEQGFTHGDIAVLTALGVQSSSVLGKRLGNVQLVDCLPLTGQAVFATTIRRFKGLERPVIVLCEVDGRLSPDDVEALMYVGTSRAKTYLVVLMGQDAPQTVRAAFSGLM